MAGSISTRRMAKKKSDSKLPRAHAGASHAAAQAKGARARERERDGETEAESADNEGETRSNEEDDDALVGELVDTEENERAAPAAKATARESSGSLTHYDPLQVYMRDIQRYPLLSPDDEHTLAVRYFQTQDVDAAARLVTANLRLVVKIAYDYRRAYRNLMDLVQEGNIGLMQAVKKYDPYKGVKLSSYAAWWIRAYILRFILNNWRLVKIGTTQAQRKLFFNLNKEKARLAALGIEPSPEEIARRLDVTTDEVVQMDRRLSGGDLSLDAPVGGSEGRALSRIEMLPAKSGRIDDMLADQEMSGLLRSKIEQFGRELIGKDAIIFRDRLLSDEPRTLQELGTEFGVSRERVRQLEKRLQQKLKRYLYEQLGEGILDVE